MKIIHTADLHLGQIIYQQYERVREHDAFFEQLEGWCREEKPDALVVSGDVFDIQQPSAGSRKYFADRFVALHKAVPEMKIVITAGNHDSASRLQAEAAVWAELGVTIVGLAPTAELQDGDDDWQGRYVVELERGYIVAFPYMAGERKAQIQSVLDYVESRNTEEKPVVLMAHLAVSGMDATGHGTSILRQVQDKRGLSTGIEIGHIKTQDAAALGKGYDYLALGHIHMPQTIGRKDDRWVMDEVTYPSGVIRYSGSALHVSCDEQFLHTVSVVSIDRRGGDVTIRQKRIKEEMHFYTLPEDDSSYASHSEALDGIKRFCTENGKGYIRLQMEQSAVLSSDFMQMVYNVLEPYKDEVRFNPKIIWTGAEEKDSEDDEKPIFEIADLQQMTDPMAFIEATHDQYPELDMDMLKEMFDEVKTEVERQNREE